MSFSPQDLRRRLPLRAGADDTAPAVKRWWVGLSGGLDSSVLLQALVALKRPEPITAIHINHGLSPHAAQWQEHCECLCRELGVEFVGRTLALDGSTGIEQAAREARYQVFSEYMGPGDVLLLGHHLQDQAETVLFRLLRGAGVRGLAAMRPARALAGGWLARPLLFTERAALERYAKACHLPWVEDESNNNHQFDRNYLRHNIMPRLSQRWPQAASNFARSAEHLADAEQLLNELAQLDIARAHQRCEPTGCSILWQPLAQLPAHRRHNALRYLLRQRHLTVPATSQLLDWDRQLLAGQHQSTLRLGSAVLHVFAERLYVLNAHRQWSPTDTQAAIAWPNPSEQPLNLPGGDQLLLQSGSGEGIAQRWRTEPWEVRWRVGGERCRPAGRRHSQQLKKLLQEYRLATWLRPRVPLIYIGGQLAAVADVWVCQEFAATAGEPGYSCQWHFCE